MSNIPMFHLAFPVTDLSKARDFYGKLLGCVEGRSTEAWIDFNFFGHQIVAHLVPDKVEQKLQNYVDGDHVPIPHFGIILSMKDWRLLADKLNMEGIEFVIKPHIRFKDQPGEQATMFILDSCGGNALEFKAFTNFDQVFAK